MPLPAHSILAIDAIRAASRQIVRELGFMGGNFAGTDLSPSAVHALIEIETGRVTARDLGARLHLEKSSISRMLRKLVELGEVTEHAGSDGRFKELSLTDKGQKRAAAIHAFARAQVSDALGRISQSQRQTVIDGLNLYATALASSGVLTDRRFAFDVVEGYRTGLIARITQMHAFHYARTSGFGRQFESVVAGGLSDFCNRLDSRRNSIWAAVQGEEIVGSVAIDGEDIGGNKAHLRWFIVDERVSGAGIGRKLLSAALDFVDQSGFEETHLWTFSGLEAARHLYEGHGFALEEEWLGTQWGNRVLEQKFVRKHT